MQDREREFKSLKTRATIVYILYLVSLVVGVALIAGVILAYLSKSRAEESGIEFLADNFRWQINTFWGFLGFILLPILAVLLGITSQNYALISLLGGLAVLSALAGVIWFIYRIIKGWIALSDGRMLYTS